MKLPILVAAALALPLLAQAAEPAQPAAPAAPSPAAVARPAPAPAAPAAAAGEAKAKLTIDSTVGELIDNPRTDAVLKRVIPDARNNENFPTIGRDLSLREISQYEESITQDKLNVLVQELAKAQAGEEAKPAAQAPSPPPPAPAAQTPAPPARQP